MPAGAGGGDAYNGFYTAGRMRRIWIRAAPLAIRFIFRRRPALLPRVTLTVTHEDNGFSIPARKPRARAFALRPALALGRLADNHVWITVSIPV